MDSEILVDTWIILSQYIKDKQHAADHWINELIDLGIDDETLEELANADKYLGIAIDELSSNSEDDDYEFEDE
jgi:predicted nucleic acid-binding protein